MMADPYLRCSPPLATWFRRQPVRRKLTTTVLSTSGVTMLAACAVFAIYDYLDTRARLVREVTLLADMIGTNSIAPLAFNDATAASDALRATAVNEHIVDVQLFMPGGAFLAGYVRAGGPARRRASVSRAPAPSPSFRRIACGWSGPSCSTAPCRLHQRQFGHRRDRGSRKAIHRDRQRHPVRGVLDRAWRSHAPPPG